MVPTHPDPGAPAEVLDPAASDGESQLDDTPDLYRYARSMSQATSAWGRRQLSAEKAYRVSTPIPASGAASTMRRTIAAPARCPAERERPCRVAHRPLPSMMMPT